VDEGRAVRMVRSIASTLENHHRVQVLDEALEAAVKLSHRYIPARQLPDKAVSLLDTTCTRIAISQSAVPAPVEDSRRRIEALETELEIIARETTVGVETAERRQTAARTRLEAEQERRAELEERWEQEQGLVDRILDLRAWLRGQTGQLEDTGTELQDAAAAAVEALGPGDPAPAPEEGPADPAAAPPPNVGGRRLGPHRRTTGRAPGPAQGPPGRDPAHPPQRGRPGSGRRRRRLDRHPGRPHGQERDRGRA